MPLSRLLEAHFRQILRLEDGAARRLLATYRQAEEELTARLADLDARGMGDSFTAQHLALVKTQIDAVLSQMTSANVATLKEAALHALNTGAAQSLAEIADLERRFGDGDLADRLQTISPVIPSEMVSNIADPQALLLSKFRDGTFVDVSRELAQSMLQGEGISKAIWRLRRVMEGQRYQLERIARTEINHAANTGHHSQLDAVASQFPEMGLQKQWSSHLDGRTSKRCIGLDGDIQDVDKPFERDGWSGMHPPSHPNCRSRVNPYCKRWTEGKQQRTEEEKAKIAEMFGNDPRGSGGPADGETINEKARKSWAEFRSQNPGKTDAELAEMAREQFKKSKFGKMREAEQLTQFGDGNGRPGEKLPKAPPKRKR